MSSTSTPRFRLRNPELLQTLMQHTGDGTRTTIRDLADHAGVHHSFIGKVATGEQETVTAEVATAVSRRIGVDLLVIWAPAERTTAVLASRAAEPPSGQEVAA